MKRILLLALLLALPVPAAEWADAPHTVTVATSPTRLDQTPSTRNRSYVTIWNNSTSATLYVGVDLTVAASGTAQGIPVLPGAWVQLPFSTKVTVYGIAATGTISATVLETGP